MRSMTIQKLGSGTPNYSPRVDINIYRQDTRIAKQLQNNVRVLFGLNLRRSRLGGLGVLAASPFSPFFHFAAIMTPLASIPYISANRTGIR